MKSVVALILLISAVSFSAVGGEGEKPVTDALAPAHDFEFRVELRDKNVVFETVHGTHWNGLSWAIGDEGPMEFWLDESGVASHREDLKGSDFLIKFQQTPSGAIMISSGGTSWRELGLGCGASLPCKYLVNENGVQGL